jgi:hypothetical protein
LRLDVLGMDILLMANAPGRSSVEQQSRHDQEREDLLSVAPDSSRAIEARR